MSELVKGAVAEAEAYDKQVGVGSTDVPATVQLGRAAQASMQVSPLCLPSRHNSLHMLYSLAPSCLHIHFANAVNQQLHRKHFNAG